MSWEYHHSLQFGLCLTPIGPAKSTTNVIFKVCSPVSIGLQLGSQTFPRSLTWGYIWGNLNQMWLPDNLGALLIQSPASTPQKFDQNPIPSLCSSEAQSCNKLRSQADFYASNIIGCPEASEDQKTRWVNKELTDVLKQNTEHIRIGMRGNEDVTMTPAKQNNPSKFIPIMQVTLCQQSCDQLQKSSRGLCYAYNIH